MEIKRYSNNLYKVFDDYVEIYIHNYKTQELLGIIKVDLEDYELIKDYKWCLNHNGYARHGKLGLMHRLIMKAKSNQIIDHINEDKLDNRKANLRIADKSLNTLNNSKARSDSKTGIRGVTMRRGKYRATITIDGRQYYLGDFDTLEKAKHKYEEYRKGVI